MLNKQVGVVNFEPLKPLFLQAYQHSHVYVPANASLPPLRLNVRRNPETAELRDALPAVPLNYNELKATEVADANKYFARGKFVEALATFKNVLSKLLLVVVESEEDAEEVSLPLVMTPARDVLTSRTTDKGACHLLSRIHHWPHYGS